MATNNTKVTYASALNAIIAFARANGFEDTDILEKADKLASKYAPTTKNGKTKARKDNEALAIRVYKSLTDRGIATFDNPQLRELFPNIVTSAARGTAVLNAGVDMGLFTRHVTQKSATRNILTYTVNDGVNVDTLTVE